MTSLRKSTKFVVVEFDENDSTGKPIIELLPRSWLIFEESGTFAFYPTDISDRKISKLIEREAQPDNAWPKFAVNCIIAQSRDHAQGLGRIGRAVISLEPEPSTDADSQYGLSSTTILTHRELERILSEKNVLPETSDVTLNMNHNEPTNELNGNSIPIVTVLAECQSEEPQGINLNVDVLRYLDEKFREMDRKMDSKFAELSRQIISLKRSLLYDFAHKMNDLKIMVNQSAPVTSMAVSQLFSKLPCTTLEEFLEFENSMKNDEEKFSNMELVTIMKENGLRLLEVLLRVSEKAANIARTCRQKDALFKLLVQEKLGDEKNPRFFQDFKTLADVLIQETIRHDIGIEFPELAKMVRGEETNVFSNTLGKTVVVEVCSTSSETTQLLAEVLDHDAEIAELLASETHKDITLDEVPFDVDIANFNFDIDIDDLGIWIDPIDSTADYISGEEVVDEATGLHLGGLRCVTVLIGAYVKSTGLPVVGVVNQPFHTHRDSQWKGRCYWGYFGDENTSGCSFTIPEEPTDILLLGRNEDAAVKTKLLEHHFQTIELPGAGYKILSVAIGDARAYVLSKSTTFRWDTCAPQALLRSIGGGIVDYAKFISGIDLEDCQLLYSGDDKNFANVGGLIAYRDNETLESLRRALLK